MIISRQCPGAPALRDLLAPGTEATPPTTRAKGCVGAWGCVGAVSQSTSSGRRATLPAPAFRDQNRRDIGKISVNMDRFQDGNGRLTPPPSPSRSAGMRRTKARTKGGVPDTAPACSSGEPPARVVGRPRADSAASPSKPPPPMGALPSASRSRSAGAPGHCREMVMVRTESVTEIPLRFYSFRGARLRLRCLGARRPAWPSTRGGRDRAAVRPRPGGGGRGGGHDGVG
jgi:hypothetical protein